MAGGAPRHTISMTTGGTTHTANQSALLASVIDTPDNAAAPATARTPTQAVTTFRRTGDLSMRGTLSVVDELGSVRSIAVKRDRGDRS